MRARVEILAIILLILLIGVLTSLSRHEDVDIAQMEPEKVVHSSYRTFPEGYKALYATLMEAGVPVHRQIRPYGMLPDRGLLIATDAYRTDVSELESRDLLKWIRVGNHALFLVEHHPAYVAQALGRPKPIEDEPHDHDDTWLRGTKSAAVTAKPTAPSFLSEQAPALRIASSVRFDPDALLPPNIAKGVEGGVPLYTDGNGVAVVYCPLGKGGIVLCGSPWSFSNKGIKEEKNLEFVLALANLQPGAPVIFDEYHHGFGANMSVWDLAPVYTKWGIAQCALAVLLLLVTLAWRFGPPRLPAEERFARTRAEYLTAMAGLLERVGATHVVRERLGVLLRRELGRRLGLPAYARDEQFLAANTAHQVVDPAALERILRNMAAIEQQQRPTPGTMLRLSAEVHRLLHRKG